tara:strand:- start:126 stop:560 length:435 start_codon:yes stop_codon:yes gene_type:complete
MNKVIEVSKFLMKTNSVIGVAISVIGMFLGTHSFACEAGKHGQHDHSAKVGYVVITGTTTDRQAAKEYFENINDFTKRCGFKTLVLDSDSDVREGDKGPLTVIVRHPKGKQAAIDCYESNEYQRLKAIRDPYTDWNFRITEGSQ